MILDSAVQVAEAMQDFELESFLMGAEHSQKVKAAPIKNDSDSIDCVDLAASTAEFRMMFACLKKLLSHISFVFLFVGQTLSVSFAYSQFYTSSDEFIEEVFEIKIPYLEGAYNASIIEYQEGYLMAFRYDSYILPISAYPEEYYQYIGIIYLDQDFVPHGDWFLCLADRCYDPRLINVNGTIHLIYASPRESEEDSLHSSHLNMCTVHHNGDAVMVSDCIELKAPFQQNWEKNWVPFSYRDRIHFSYTIFPHVVIKPVDGMGTCEVVANHRQALYWPYGIIRGGTPASLVDGNYLGFFHSSHSTPAPWEYVYHIGAYIYSPKPPFSIMAISSKPFCHTDFYSSKRRETTVSSVLFPGGYVIKGDKIYLCYGENDSVIKIMVINKSLLYRSLFYY